MLKITVGNTPLNEDAAQPKTREVVQKKEGWFIDEQLFDGDIAYIDKQHLSVIWKSRSYNVEILEFDTSQKSAHLIIDGQHFYTTAKDRLDLLLEGMGLEAASSQKLNHIKAPMPGLIQSVSVSAGDQISKGDTLLVLVAMKMENVIKSSGNGIVKSLNVTAGEIVEKNQVLLEFQ